MFLIKLWLLISEEERSLQALDVAGQGILGFSSHLLEQPHLHAVGLSW